MTNTVKILIIAGVFLGSLGSSFGVTRAIRYHNNKYVGDEIVVMPGSQNEDPDPIPAPMPTPARVNDKIAINSVNVKFDDYNRRYELIPQLDSATVARKDSIVYILYRGGTDESMKVGEYSGKISGVKQDKGDYYLVALNPVLEVKSEAFKVDKCKPQYLNKKTLESAINKAGRGNGILDNKIELAIGSSLKISVHNGPFSSASYFVQIIQLIKGEEFSSVTVNDVKYSESDDYRVSHVDLTFNK